MSYSKEDILDMLKKTPLADTHEHLLNEKDRLANGPKDIGIFFTQYLDGDWELCGMEPAMIERLKDPAVEAEEKWAIVKPFWPLVRYNAYGQMIRRSLKLLYGFDDFTDENIAAIQSNLERDMTPGYYKHILDKCNIQNCQINALDVPHFRQPDIDTCYGDLCVTTLCSNLQIGVAEDLLGRNVNELSDLTDAIDLIFERHGKNAIAVKNQAAYTRPLHFARWEDAVAEHTLDYCMRKKWDVEKGERKPLEDFLTHYTIDKAVEYALPYKFHTGMTSGCNSTLFYTVRDHAADCAYLCTEHPDANFIFMHMFYPYQHEALALAKQYPNAYIDMCWSWMVNPQAAKQFLKEAVVTVPLHKILLFGGDVSYIELLPGHVEMARQGIASALFELVEEKWLKSNDLKYIIERLFNGNARELFVL